MIYFLIYLSGVLFTMILAGAYTYFSVERSVTIKDVVHPAVLLSWIYVSIGSALWLIEAVGNRWPEFWEKFSKRVVIRRR